MKWTVLFGWLIACSALAQSDDPSATKPASSPPPSLDRTTISVNSCKQAGSNTNCQGSKFLRKGSLFYLRQAQGRDVSLITANLIDSANQPPSHAINVFGGEIVKADPSAPQGPMMTVEFLDDPIGQAGRMKLLVLHQVQWDDDQQGIEVCQQRLEALSASSIDNTATLCNRQEARSGLVHWRICSQYSAQHECLPASTRSPPEDGQGTGSCCDNN